MSLAEKLIQARTIVNQYNQNHLLQFYDELGLIEQEFLLDQILSVDFILIEKLFSTLVKAENAKPIQAEKIEPMQAQNWEQLGLTERALLANQGMRALREGKVAAFLVAGGQGTRLGHSGPKGIFDIGLPSHKSLFQLQAERILSLSRQVKKNIPWYIMTSEENHHETVSFFSERNFFALSKNDIFFFKQGELPVVDDEGKILLASKSRLSMGPNGNGGCFLALNQSGALADMQKRGVEYLFFYSVDNALVKICDPHFIGFTMQSQLPAASKAVTKASPQEKVGVLCLRNGRPSVVEYSEMTDEMITAQNESGELLFNSANIAVHLFKTSFLQKHASSALPYHLAHKKITYTNKNGDTITPPTPNAFKFELFMFDLFPLAGGMAAMQVKREEEFAPVKNKDGIDSPGSARALVLALHRKWALAVGISETKLSEKELEISPLDSYAGEGLNTEKIRALL